MSTCETMMTYSATCHEEIIDLKDYADTFKERIATLPRTIDEKSVQQQIEDTPESRQISENKFKMGLHKPRKVYDTERHTPGNMPDFGSLGVTFENTFTNKTFLISKSYPEKQTTSYIERYDSVISRSSEASYSIDDSVDNVSLLSFPTYESMTLSSGLDLIKSPITEDNASDLFEINSVDLDNVSDSDNETCQTDDITLESLCDNNDPNEPNSGYFIDSFNDNVVSLRGIKQIEKMSSSQNYKEPDNNENDSLQSCDLENFESDISDASRAYKESMETQSMQPILKEELRCLIMCRRLSRGEPEMVEDVEQYKDHKLTTKEVRQINERRAQNRRSAKKARAKAKESTEQLAKKVDESGKKQTRLCKELKKLQDKKRTLLKELIEHLKVCAKSDLVKTQNSLLSRIVQ